MEEHFTLATDEGPFHGGDASAPPPLALFVGGLTGCIMTQLRAFAKRMDVVIDDLRVETKVSWQWTPKSFDIDIILESPSPVDRQIELVQAAKPGCFVEQTLSVANSITHRIRTDSGFLRIS